MLLRAHVRSFVASMSYFECWDSSKLVLASNNCMTLLIILLFYSLSHHPEVKIPLLNMTFPILRLLNLFSVNQLKFKIKKDNGIDKIINS